MARKVKGQLPSGNIRRQVTIGKKEKRDKNGNIIYGADGLPVMIPNRISVTATTRQDAALQAAEIKRKQKINTHIDSNITLRQAISRYIELNSAQLSESTVNGYRIILDYGFTHIIDKKISVLSMDMLQEAVDIESNRKSQSRNARGTSKTISAKTLKNEFGLISTVLKQYRPDLDTAQINKPQVIPTIHELTSAETIYQLFKGTDMELPVLLAMWLSFTESEIKGLTKSKSIFGDYIYINQVMIRVNGKNIIKDVAKNPHRNRFHRIPQHIRTLIDRIETDELVPCSAHTLYNRFRRTLEKNNLPHMTFHDLRHLNVSVLHVLQIPDKYIMDRGGWKTDSVMKGVYLQTLSPERVKVDNTIDQYFNETVLGITVNPIEEKYQKFLQLFELPDDPISRSLFVSVLFQGKTAHETAHEKTKA